MSNHSIINLLIVDRSLSECDAIAKTLRSGGYALNVSQADQGRRIQEIIKGKPLDLILVKPEEQVPTITEIHAWVYDLLKDIPIVAIMDAQTRQRPAELLRAGAENLFHLDTPEHLVMVITNELRHLQVRRQARRCENRLKESEARCRALLDSSRQAISYIHEGAHIYANPAYLSLFGYASAEDLEAETLMNRVIPEDRDRLKEFLRRCSKEAKPAVEPVKLTGLHSDGTHFPIQMECTPTYFHDEPCLQILVQDGSPRDEINSYDVLTGAYNRRFFSQYLERQIQNKVSGAVLYILLIDYRAISERLGLEAVDQLVIATANLLRQIVAKDGIVAHFTDATFTVFIPTGTREAALALGERIRKAISEQVCHAARNLITTTCCIGIGMVDENHSSATQVLFQADRACETARQMGGNQVQFYSPPDRAGDSQGDKGSFRLLEDALAKERLVLLYQPIASLRGDSQARYQVHLRLLDNNNQPHSMHTLAPAAERYELMGKLDQWVIARSLAILTTRQQIGQPIELFIRISRHSVANAGFGDWLQAHLKESGLAANALIIEVEEGCAEHYFKETKMLRERLYHLGCGLSLCHFGGKPNSERILHHLSPNYAKLEGTLIEQFATDSACRQTLITLIEQAGKIGSRLVAEDVTNALQLASLWQLGVTLVQGSVVQEPNSMMNFDFQQFAG